MVNKWTSEKENEVKVSFRTFKQEFRHFIFFFITFTLLTFHNDCLKIFWEKFVVSRCTQKIEHIFALRCLWKDDSNGYTLKSYNLHQKQERFHHSILRFIWTIFYRDRIHPEDFPRACSTSRNTLIRTPARYQRSQRAEERWTLIFDYPVGKLFTLRFQSRTPFFG